MAVTDDNGRDLLSVPVQEVGGDRQDPGEILGGRGSASSPGGHRKPPGPLDSEASSRGGSAGVPGLPGPLGIQGADPFPAVTGSKPGELVPRYPQPVALEGEEAVTAARMPQVITTAWIRGQVDAKVWQKHWAHGGRITPAMIHEYYQGLCKGISQAGIRRRLGISETTWYEWGKAADKGGEIHRLFKQVVEAGLGNIEQEVVDAWVSKVPDDWRAAEAFLKVRFPAEWSPTSQVQVQHAGVVDVDHKLSLDDDDLLRVADILRSTGALEAGAGEVVDAEVVGEDG